MCESPEFRRLFGLRGITGVDPLIPAAFEGPHVGEAHSQQLLRRPGAAALEGSGAVKYELLVLGQLLSPGLHGPGVAAQGAGDFLVAGLPIPGSPGVNNYCPRVIEPASHGLFIHPGRVCGPRPGDRQGQTDRRH